MVGFEIWTTRTALAVGLFELQRSALELIPSETSCTIFIGYVRNLVRISNNSVQVYHRALYLDFPYEKPSILNRVNWPRLYRESPIILHPRAFELQTCRM